MFSNEILQHFSIPIRADSLHSRSPFYFFAFFSVFRGQTKVIDMSISLIPETAPFNAEQRAWLNGFLAGWAGLQGDGAIAAASLAGASSSATVVLAKPEEVFPWHDPNLAMDDRLALAEGKPLERELDVRDGAAQLRRLRVLVPDILGSDRPR